MSEIDTAVRTAIQHERERRGLATDRELAEQLGVFPKHISRWKNGKFTKLDRVLLSLILRNSDRAA